MHSQPEPPIARPAEITTLLRGEAESLQSWLHHGNAGRWEREAAVILIGSGCYGAAMGWWRSPEQALFVAVKFPLIILLTMLGNALLNAMLAPLLGLNLTLRQTLRAVLMSFTISSAIMGAFSPLIAFMVWNAPAMAAQEISGTTYNLILLSHVMVIALAGITGNVRLFQLLSRVGGSRAIARRVLFAWLAGNLFFGSQLAWILRPFIGSPTLPVEFYRASALHGNFFEAVLRSLLQIFHRH
ncbi:MAG: hypothetical protein WCH99_07295 [Verrucomicrobiota bacterium]